MIISHELKYVYIGIPRTGSKSMHQWLHANYAGEWHGMHGSDVPEECKDYLVFTTVRNPYERCASGQFGLCWNDEPATPEGRVPSPVPAPSLGIPHDQLIRDSKRRGEGECGPHGFNQSNFIKKAGVSLALFFERLPECLKDLPFVDPDNVPPFPYALEKGIRPPGTFFDHFGTDYEVMTWAYASEDFEMLGYQRYDPFLPKDSPNSLNV